MSVSIEMSLLSVLDEVEERLSGEGVDFPKKETFDYEDFVDEFEDYGDTVAEL
jgi:hypothetical protein